MVIFKRYLLLLIISFLFFVFNERETEKNYRSVSSVELQNFNSRDVKFYNRKDSKFESLQEDQKIIGRLKIILLNLKKDRFDTEKAGKIAQQYIVLPSGHIKKLALQILNQLELEEKNRDLVISEIVSYHDSKLILPAVIYLKRYIDRGMWGKEIDFQVKEVFLVGSYFVRRELAKDIKYLVTSTNYVKYKDILKEINPRSDTYEILKRTLDRFQLFKNDVGY